MPQADHNQDPSDPLSYVAAWLSLLPQALCVTYATLLWATREAEVALMFIGQMGCEALNFGLKRWIKEERPQRTPLSLFLTPAI
jgi:dolichyldiphosphatase